MAGFNIENLYLFRAKFVMKLLGVWMPPEKENLLRKLYRIFMMSLQYLFLIFQFIYIVQEWGDLDAVSNASYLLFTQACLCFKVTVFHINIEMLRDLLTRMNADIFKPQSIEHEKILKYQASRIKRLLLGFMISSQATCGMWALKPLFDDAGSRKFPFDMWQMLRMLRQLARIGATNGWTNGSTNSHEQALHSQILTRMPVKPEQSPAYHFGYAFQLMTICMSAYMYFGVDSVALSMVIFGCAQIDIVKDKIKSIKPAWNRKGNERKEVLLQNYKTLAECIEQHHAIVTFAQLVEDAYHTYLLFQLSGSVGLICMSALRILVVEPKSMQFLSIMTYLLVMISQLYVCCWCGHELTSTSEELHITLYQCLWYEQDIKFQRAIIFAMMRTLRPMELKAGHYIRLSRQNFVAILRMSYSYFAVLNQTNH